MARDHGFHPVRITRIIDETPDVRTFSLDAQFPYRAGQFLTFKACGTLRSYSMSSSPETDTEISVTVKRVPGGLVSGWMHTELRAGDVLEVTRPSGSFCLRAGAAGRPLIAYAGGSGITPVFSLVKSALATTDRPVVLLSAHPSAQISIFQSSLDALAARYPGRLVVRHHLDDRHGLVTRQEAVALVPRQAQDADFYVCGPAPFMALVEDTLTARGVAEDRILIERFTPAQPSAPAPSAEAVVLPVTGSVTVDLRGQRRTVPQRTGETLLQSARRAGFTPPFSCESGECATCMARLTVGEAKMHVNNALADDEVAEGWVLTCQAEPTTPDVTVVYEN
ncbi:ferredoxin--NADP reductase [Streptomyces sp. NPDC048385]|uniref:ferredoxin--NADP reductase n=1 Tax=Streptomyces sp. NPDC048385 TaxID=3155145 RepID=UPI00343FFAD5